MPTHHDHRPTSHTVTAPPVVQRRPHPTVTCSRCGSDCFWGRGYWRGVLCDFAACTRCAWSERDDDHALAERFDLDVG